MKPPRQPVNLLNKSTVQNKPTTSGGVIPPFVDMGFSFENKENQSLNLDEFSPSRIVEPAGRSGEPGNRRQRVANLLDSDSSMSSPKPIQHDAVASSSGPQTGKSYFMDKSSFLKNFSPERVGNVTKNHDPTSDRDLSAKTGLKIGDISAVGDISIQNNSSKAAAGGTTVISGYHRIHLKVVDKMIKEKLKMMKHKEQTEDQSRRK